MHQGSQAAEISRKSVLNNPAILAAWNGRNYLAIMSPLMTYQEAVAVVLHRARPYSPDGHRRVTLRVVCVIKSIQTIPASAQGNAVMMINGSTQDWKFTTIKR